MMQTWEIYVYVVALGIYAFIIVPYTVSKIMVRLGHSEHFWYFVTALLNVYTLFYLLIRKSIREKLLFKDKAAIILFLLLYICFIVPVWIYC